MAALTKIFERFTPIVIGYGGNDGSLMGFLRDVKPIEGGIFWCHRDDSKLDSKIHEVVEHHRGKLVPIAGFDEVMLQLQEKLELAFLLPELQSAHEKRVTGYQEQFEALNEALKKPAETPAAEEARKPVRKAAESAVERLTKEKDWWAWLLKANAEPDPLKREIIFREALVDFPDSANLTAYFAEFMEEVLMNYDEAEQLHRRALELVPNQPEVNSNYAGFMADVRKNYDEAERLYRKAVQVDPINVRLMCNLAWFVFNARKDYDEAEHLYRRALELAPNDSMPYVGLARFTEYVRKDVKEAERLYRKALELDPNNVHLLGTFAQFLGAINQFDESHSLLVRACQFLKGQSNRQRARIAFTRWLSDRAAKRNGSEALGRLKTLLKEGFTRRMWSFDSLLLTSLTHLSKNERLLAQKLSDAILDETKVAALEDEPLWKATTATSLDEPWPP